MPLDQLRLDASAPSWTIPLRHRSKSRSNDTPWLFADPADDTRAIGKRVLSSVLKTLFDNHVCCDGNYTTDRVCPHDLCRTSASTLRRLRAGESLKSN